MLVRSYWIRMAHIAMIDHTFGQEIFFLLMKW